MSIVTMGLAGMDKVTITMFNTPVEDSNLESTQPKDLNAARYALARKRLMNDTHLVMQDDGKMAVEPYASGAVVFPIN